MEFSRRGILRGLIAAPLVVVTPGLLMPVKAVFVDPMELLLLDVVEQCDFKPSWLIVPQHLEAKARTLLAAKEDIPKTVSAMGFRYSPEVVISDRDDMVGAMDAGRSTMYDAWRDGGPTEVDNTWVGPSMFYSPTPADYKRPHRVGMGDLKRAEQLAEDGKYQEARAILGDREYGSDPGFIDHQAKEDAMNYHRQFYHADVDLLGLHQLKSA